MKPTVGSYFSGGGIGLALLDKAKVDIAFGVEYDPAIAEVYRANISDRIITARVQDVDVKKLERVTLFQVSPVCKEFSAAKTGGKESAEELSQAAAICAYLDFHKPPYFLLENVRGYIKSKSFQMIVVKLSRLGYTSRFTVENSADYGGVTECPGHAANFVGNYFPRETAQDIVKNVAMMLPDAQAKFLAWDVVDHIAKIIQRDIAVNAMPLNQLYPLTLNQILKTLAGKVGESSIVSVISRFASTVNIDVSTELLLKKCLAGSSLEQRWSTTSTEIKQITLLKILKCFQTTGYIPTFTMSNEGPGCPLCKYSAVPQTRERLILRAALDRPLPSLTDYVKRWVGWYEAIEDLIPGLPESKFADWQLAQLPDYLKTFLADGTSCTIRNPNEPAPTITAALLNNTAMPRAFLMSSANASKTTARVKDEPSFTLETFGKSCKPRAFIVGQDSKCTTRESKERLFTLTAEPNREYIRAWLSQGRVVQMNPRALARFQSIPDWYTLPEKNGLACTVIGNGIPSLMGQRIIEAVLNLSGDERKEGAA